MLRMKANVRKVTSFARRQKMAREAQKKYVLGIVIFGFVILAVYQIFCPTCYEQADLSERAYGV